MEKIIIIKNVTVAFFSVFFRVVVLHFVSCRVTSFYFTFISLHFRHEFDWSKMIHVRIEYNIIFFIYILFVCTQFFQHILSIEMEMFCLLMLSFIVNVYIPEESKRTHTHITNPLSLYISNSCIFMLHNISN